MSMNPDMPSAKSRQILNMKAPKKVETVVELDDDVLSAIHELQRMFSMTHSDVINKLLRSVVMENHPDD